MRSLLAVLLLVSTAVPVHAQLRQEVELAEEELEAAVARLDALQEDRAVVRGDLVAAMDTFVAISAATTQQGLEVAEMEESISVAERNVRRLRDEVAELAVSRYIAGGRQTMLDVLLASPDITSFSTAQIVSDQVQTWRLDKMTALDEELANLQELRVGSDRATDVLRAKQDELALQVDQLDILFAGLDAEATLAHAEVLAADATYREAYDLLQEAIRLRRLAGQGVERWRPLVEHYFPAEVVDQALDVMWCESRGNPRAEHPTSGASGLFQFMEGTWSFVSPYAGFAGYSRFDPEANIASAAWLVDFSIRTGHRNGAWGRWTCQPLEL